MKKENCFIFVKNCEYDIICYDVEKVENGATTLLQYKPVDGVLTGIDFLKLQHKSKTMQIAVWHNVYKRSLLIGNDLYFKKGIYHEDEEWTPRVFMQAESVVHVQNSFYRYMIRENSIMKQRDFSKHIKDMSSTLQEFVARYNKAIDAELFSLLKDRLVDRYLSIYAKGNFYNRGKDFILSRALLNKNLYFRKTKMKLYIFLFSKRLFCRMSRVYITKRKG